MTNRCNPARYLNYTTSIRFDVDLSNSSLLRLYTLLIVAEEYSHISSSLLIKLSQYIGDHPEERPLLIETLLLEESRKEVIVYKKNKHSMELNTFVDSNKVRISHVLPLKVVFSS